MKVHGIKSLSDIRDIEAHPYESFMPHLSVIEALETAARAHPDRKALTYVSSPDPLVPASSWTHAEFIGEVRQAARAFSMLADGDVPRVAMLLPAIPAAYFTLWGAEAIGVASPINYLLGEEHIADLINAAQVNILVALGPNEELDIWSRVPGLRARCPSLKHVVAVGGAMGALDFGALLASMPPDELGGRVRTGHEVAALFHTGGTTGRPKLAQHTHRNQLHAAAGAASMYSATERDVVLNGFPLFHVAGSFVYGLSILMVGGEVVLPTLLGLRNTTFVKGYWKFVERHRVTLLATVPTVISTLLGVKRGPEDISSVRCLLTGGSPLPVELADAFEQRTGIGVRNILGMTECGGVIAIEPVEGRRTPGAAGLALPFTTLQIVDDSGLGVAIGEEGVLRIHGPNVGPGYTENANNAGVFLDDGWLDSGDIARLDEAGRVFVTGRAKDLIIRSSHNIDPMVIEEALLRHPDVLMAAAVGAPDEYAGEVPVAYVSLRPGSHADPATLMEFARANIQERPACPKTIQVLSTLPVTAIGKLYKPQLRAMAIQMVVEERLASNGLAGNVRVDVLVEGKAQVVRLRIKCNAEEKALLKQLMGAFALTCRFEVDSTAQSGATA